MCTIKYNRIISFMNYFFKYYFTLKTERSSKRMNYEINIMHNLNKFITIHPMQVKMLCMVPIYFNEITEQTFFYLNFNYNFLSVIYYLQYAYCECKIKLFDQNVIQ